MNTSQIDKILLVEDSVSKHNFLGVFALDTIPKEALTKPCCFAVKTKPHNEPGMHWVAMIKTEDIIGLYFQSYGYPPYNLPKVAEVLDTCDGWTFNNTPLQTPFSTVCG